MIARKKEHRLWSPVFIVLAVLCNCPSLLYGQTFDSGSNGTDGALSITEPTGIPIDFDPVTRGLDLDGDNVYNFTTINIGPGVIVRLTARKINGPIFWLAKGDIQVDGIIDLNGEDGLKVEDYLAGAPRVPAIAGAGGFPGGVMAFGGSPALPGSGPGGAGASGSAGHANAPFGPTGGAAYGNNFLVPLLGGSGGGSGPLGSGGAGGGALLLASSTSIRINGGITAKGGRGLGNLPGNAASGNGSGGEIRLVAPILSGSGNLNVAGGENSFAQPGSSGRIRLEAFQRNFTGTSSPALIAATPFGLYLPPTTVSTPSFIRAVKVDGVSVPPNPTGSFTIPDVTINQSMAVTVELEAHNIPLGTKAKLYIFPETGTDQIIESTPLTGTVALSTAMATINNLPPGFSRGFVRATWPNQ